MYKLSSDEPDLMPHRPFVHSVTQISEKNTGFKHEDMLQDMYAQVKSANGGVKSHERLHRACAQGIADHRTLKSSGEYAENSGGHRLQCLSQWGGVACL